MNNLKLTQLLLRVALAFAFLYAAISAYLTPQAWIGYFPPFLQALIPEPLLILSFSLIEVIVGLWLLSNKYVFYAAIVAALMLASIIVFNFNLMEIIFRDVSLLICALALASASFKKDKVK